MGAIPVHAQSVRIQMYAAGVGRPMCVVVVVVVVVDGGG